MRLQIAPSPPTQAAMNGASLGAILKLSIGVGVAVFIAGQIVLGTLLGPRSCSDGWESSSIGRRGACSSHGGVDQTIPMLTLLLGIVGGIGAGRLTWRLRNPAPSKPANRNAPSSPNATTTSAPPKDLRLVLNIPPIEDEGNPCPKCGGEMVEHMTNVGPRAGTVYLGCAQFPYCSGIRQYAA